MSWIAGAQLGRITSYPLGQSFETIQEAIAASPARSTIVIRSGTYAEQLIIDKPLTLLGRGQVALESPDVETDADNVVLSIVEAEGVTIENLRIEAFYTGIEIRRSSCSIVKCALDVSGVGIQIEARGSERVHVQECIVRHPKVPGGGTGILILGAGSVDLRSCTFERLATGVISAGLTAMRIHDCSFQDCFDSLVLSGLGETVLIGNRFEGSRNVALRTGWTPQPYPGGLVGSLAFVDNVFLDSARWGIDLCVDVDDGTWRLNYEGTIVGTGNVIEDDGLGYGPYCPSDYAWPDGFFAEPEPASDE